MGVTLSGRNVPVGGIDRMTGPTITTMPVRVIVEASKTAEEMLVQIQQQTIDSIPYEHMGLQKLKELGPDCAAACQFENLLVIQPQSKAHHRTIGKLINGGFNVRLHNYDFVLECGLAVDNVNAVAHYDSNALNTDRATAIVNQFASILTQIHTSPEASIAAISGISPEDFSQLQKWNKVIPDAVDLCVHDIILRHTLAHPDALAVSSWDGDMTYIELDRLSSTVAACLRKHHIGPECIVPLHFQRSRWTMVAMLGVMKAGGAFVLLDPSHPMKQKEGICRQVNVKIVFTSSGKSDMADMHGITTITVGPEPFKASESSSPLTGSSMPSIQPPNAVYVVFTSGSTGTPKGTVIEHRAFASNALFGLFSKVLNEQSRVLQFASYAFDASIAEILFTLTSGGCVCVPRESDRTNIVDCVNSSKVIHLFFTPSVARTLDPHQLTTLKALVLVGEPMKPGDVATWADHVQLVNAYGPSECCISSVEQFHVTSTSKPANIGTSSSAATWIVDPEDHNKLLPIGATGELLIEGPIVGRGYLNEPEKTSAAFIDSPSWLRSIRGRKDRVYKTGDLVQYSAQMDGSLVYIGRKDNQIKLRGQRLELGEVEYQILQCAVDVKDAIVELVAPDGQPILVAFLWLGEAEHDGILGDFNSAFQSLVWMIASVIPDHLPLYMIPSRFLPLRRVPTYAGKADRNRLREMAASLSPEQMQSFQAATRKQRTIATTESERLLQELVANVLHMDGNVISLESNFFQLGGDSLTAMRLVSCLRKMSCNVRVTDIYKQPVLSRLAERIQNVG